MAIGTTTWVIVDGWIPPTSTGPAPEMTSHDTVCILNAGDEDALVDLTICFTDREPVGPYRLCVAARRAHHQRFNDLASPVPVPVGVDFSCVVSSDHPVVVQQTRLDSRQAANALLSTIAYPVTS
ncbi:MULTISPECIES: sensory rhodopsin transducer [unclassified Mycolicibacterium]|uniref:sensory rhodopsin transducer n=1 Tax=unclassified Mycolicibacterium TaxID=2636767 RepID=UPI002EDB83D4